MCSFLIASITRRFSKRYQYDKGGLPVSTHIPTFQEKLCSPDCKCVIVVCDKEYLNRSRETGNTGVAQEYKFISTGVAQKQRTYIMHYTAI